MDERLESLVEQFKRGNVTPDEFTKSVDRVVQEIRSDDIDAGLEQTVDQERVRAAATKARKL